MLIEVLHEGEFAPSDRPLVTFWVQCYAHERFVADSVRSALAQTHRPLEVVISDDASPDGTFRVAREVARAYAGPHRVVLLRSEQNRGIFEHANEVIPHLRGDFIVWQSSDDVADPERAAGLLSAASVDGFAGAFSNHRVIDHQGRDLGLDLRGHFVVRQPSDDVAEPERVAALRDAADVEDFADAFSNHRVIDDEGRDPCLGLPSHAAATLGVADYASGRFLDFTYGGTMGFVRDVLHRFGPLPSQFGARGLEHCFGLRIALLGGSGYVARPLVCRRRHDHSLTEGISAADRRADPLVVHEQRVVVRLMILTKLRSHLLGSDRHPCPMEPVLRALDPAEPRSFAALRGLAALQGFAASCMERIPAFRERRTRAGHDALSGALTRQVVVEAERLVQLRAFQTQRARATEADAAQFEHAGSSYDPPALHFVRELPGERNLLAFECMYHAVPRALGPIEPCRLRNHDYDGVISAFTEKEVVQQLSLVGDETALTRSRGFRRRVR